MSNWLARLNSEYSFLILRFMQIASMTLFQLVFPVLFISRFGITSYGEWVISVSIVSFLGFLDFGLFNSVINDAIALRSIGQDDSAKKLLDTLAKFIVFTSFALTLMISSMVFVLPFHIDNRTLIAILGFGVILQVLIRLNESVSRAYLNASGFAVLVTSYIVESTLLAFAVYSKFDLVKIATLLVCSRSMFVTFGFFLNRKYLSPLKVIRSNLKEITIFFKQNIGKGVGFLSLPIGYLVLFDFSNVILGSVISREFVAELSLLRISTGVIRQFSSAILTSYSPVVSQAIFSQDVRILKLLQKRMRFTLILTISIISALLLISSNFIFSYYFKGTTLLSFPIFVIFAISVIIDIPWNYRSTFLFAANMHEGVAMRFLLSSVLAIVAVYYLGPLMGIFGVIISFCIQDILLTRYAFKKSSIFFQSPDSNNGANIV